MENEEGKKVDLYIPRKWCVWLRSHVPERLSDRQTSSATNRLITAKDHASVQINVGHVDQNGNLIQGEYTPFVLSGFVRQKGDADASFNALAQKAGFLKNVIEPRH